MAKEIPYSDKSDPSLVSVEAFRALVDRVNVLSNMTVNRGQLLVTTGNAVLTIDGVGSAGGGGGTGDEYYIVVPAVPLTGGDLTLMRLKVLAIDADTTTTPYVESEITYCEDGDPVTNVFVTKPPP